MKAFVKNIRSSPRKLNLVAGMVRGMPAEEAITRLKFTPKKSARIIYKAVVSAVANAEHNNKLRRKDLVISRIVVQKGVLLKRGIAVSRGRWHRIKKYGSHLEVELKEIKPAVSEPKKKPAPAKVTTEKRPAKAPRLKRKSK